MSHRHRLFTAINFITHVSSLVDQLTQLITTTVITTVTLITCCCYGICCQPIRQQLSTDVGQLYVRRQIFVCQYCRPSKIGLVDRFFSFVWHRFKRDWNYHIKRPARTARVIVQHDEAAIHIKIRRILTTFTSKNISWSKCYSLLCSSCCSWNVKIWGPWRCCIIIIFHPNWLNMMQIPGTQPNTWEITASAEQTDTWCVAVKQVTSSLIHLHTSNNCSWKLNTFHKHSLDVTNHHTKYLVSYHDLNL